MDYQHKKFTVGLTSDAYASGWDRIFAPKLKCVDCRSTEGTSQLRCPNNNGGPEVVEARCLVHRCEHCEDA